MRDWRSYIGLPHLFEADPSDGKGADCLILSMGILDDLGLPHPAIDPHWFDLARRGCWGELETIWRHLTEPVDTPEDGAVTLFKNGPSGLGVGTVIDKGLLLVHHRRGVSWIPLNVLRPFDYRRFV